MAAELGDRAGNIVRSRGRAGRPGAQMDGSCGIVREMAVSRGPICDREQDGAVAQGRGLPPMRSSKRGRRMNDLQRASCGSAI